tara:strand:+ start:4699 stop:5175 length:477 start_codon:yes stop_codon:yes gene_type:complete
VSKNNNYIFIAIGTIAAFFCAPGMASANEPVIFNPNIPAHEYEIVQNFLSESQKLERADILIAKNDLNDDGLFEYIVKDKACPAGAPCSHYILAENQGQIILIGTFKAKNITISDQHTHGIHDILVYNHKTSDYRPRIYKWDARLMHYKDADTQAEID